MKRSSKIMLAAMTEAAQWDPAIKLSVNISPMQLGDSWLAQRIVRLLAESGLPKSAAAATSDRHWTISAAIPAEAGSAQETC